MQAGANMVWLLLVFVLMYEFGVGIRTTPNCERNKQRSFGADTSIIPCQVPRDRTQALCDLARLLESCWWSSWGWVEMQSIFREHNRCTHYHHANCALCFRFYILSHQTPIHVDVTSRKIWWWRSSTCENQNTDTFSSIPLTAIEQNLLLFPIFPACDRKIRCSVFRIISTVFQKIHSCNL